MGSWLRGRLALKQGGALCVLVGVMLLSPAVMRAGTTISADETPGVEVLDQTWTWLPVDCSDCHVFSVNDPGCLPPPGNAFGRPAYTCSELLPDGTCCAPVFSRWLPDGTVTAP